MANVTKPMLLISPYVREDGISTDRVVELLSSQAEVAFRAVSGQSHRAVLSDCPGSRLRRR
jgi:hypothetical protein